MELRHLRYFVTVAEERNITRAAARLRVAQPALSRQLTDLEDEIGVKLLERGRHGVSMTTAGREFHRRAKAVLSDSARAADAARIAGGAIAGRLTLGFPTGLHLDHLSPVIRAFREQHPRAEFVFAHHLPAAQLKVPESMTMPPMAVPWPPSHLVSEWTTMSAPKPIGLVR